jgi:hypothetical protein
MQELTKNRISLALLLSIGSLAFYFRFFGDGIAKSIASLFFAANFVILIAGSVWDGFHYARDPNYKLRFGLFGCVVIAFGVIGVTFLTLFVTLGLVLSAAGITLPDIILAILIPILFIGGIILTAMLTTWLLRRLGEIIRGKERRASTMGGDGLP